MEIRSTLNPDRIINHINIKYKNDIFLRNIFFTIIKRIKNNDRDPFSLCAISSSLCISERTLYRRLNERNITYLKIKDEIRKFYALHLLSSNKYTVDQTSKILSYRTSSAFIQSFKRWHHCTPKKWALIHITEQS